MRAFGFLGILITVVIIAFLATKLTGSLSSSGNIKAPVNQAEDVKEKSDLAALETKLNIYFQENEHYPQSLNELDNYGLGSTTFQYNLCSSTKVFIKTNTNQITLENGNRSSSQGC